MSIGFCLYTLSGFAAAIWATMSLCRLNASRSAAACDLDFRACFFTAAVVASLCLRSALSMSARASAIRATVCARLALLSGGALEGGCAGRAGAGVWIFAARGALEGVGRGGVGRGGGAGV